MIHRVNRVTHFCCACWVICTEAIAQETAAVRCTIGDRQIHAIVSPILLGMNEPYADESGRSEFPLRNTVRLAAPSGSFYVVISGIVNHTATPHTYADGAKCWTGLKCSRLTGAASGPQGAPGPLNQTVAPLPAAQQLKITLHSEAAPLSFNVDANRTTGPLRALAYIFRQNRVVMQYSGEPIKQIDIDTTGLAQAGYVGALRVQLLNTGTKHRMVLQQYGNPPSFDPIDTSLAVGDGIDLTPATDFPFKGDVLVPVGFQSTSGFTHSGIEFPPSMRGKTVRLDVSGLFIFSSFSIDGGDLGGGGGFQDVAYRFDYLRKDRYLFPTLTSFYDCRMRANGEEDGLQIWSPPSSAFVRSFPEEGPTFLSPLHRYKMSLKVPLTGKVRFDVRDWWKLDFWESDKLKKTWDNAGVLFITIGEVVK